MDYLEEKEAQEKEVESIMKSIQGYETDKSSTSVEEINPRDNPDQYEYDVAPSFDLKTELTQLFTDNEDSDSDLVFDVTD